MKPISIRNNNAGNLRPLGAGEGFQSFPTKEEGLQAMRDDLLVKVGGNSRAMASRYGADYTPTLESLISTWAPSHENDTSGYINFVAEKSGIDPTKPLTAEDVDLFMPAMVEMEGGKEAFDYFYGDEAQEMTYQEIEAPDGTILEFPSDMSDDDILAVMRREYAPQEEEFDSSKFGIMGLNSLANKSGQMGFADVTSMGVDDELRGFGRAVGSKIRGDDRPFTDLVNLGKDEIRGEHEQARQDDPAAYFEGQIAGGLSQAIPAAKGLQSVAKLQKYAQANPYRATAAISGVQGALYGFNSGEGGAGERSKEALATGLTNALIAPPLARGAQAIGNTLAPVANSLTQRAQSLFSKPITQATKPAAREVLSPEDAARMQTGEILPMTQGQATQNPARQAMEMDARKGGYGQTAQDLVNKADIEQQQAIRGVIDDIGSGTEENLTNAGKQVQRAYKGQKARVNQAYDQAKGAQSVYVNKQPISEQFVPKVKTMLREDGFDIDDLSPAGKKIIQTLDSDAMKSENITAINLQKMEFWRRKVTNNIADNTENGVMKPEAVAMSRVLQEYDRFMAKLPEDALKSGDEQALQAINKARGLRREQGVKFERDKIVKKIVQSDDLTDEELANMVLTGSTRSEKINSGSGRLVRNLKRAVGDNAPQLQEGLKRGTLARILQKGTETRTEGNSSIRMISPHKLRNELDSIVKNKSFMKEVFSPEEIKQIEAIHRDIIKIASEQAGSNNYSNTAYNLMRLVNVLPFGKAAIGETLEGLGNRAATKDIKRGLSPVLDNMIDQLTTQRRFYGASTATPISNNIVETFKEE